MSSVWSSAWQHTAPRAGAAKSRNGILPLRNIDPAAQLGLLHKLVPDARTRSAILCDNPKVIYQ
jgi:hypothetical protein